jgi:cell division protein FtsL
MKIKNPFKLKLSKLRKILILPPSVIALLIAVSFLKLEFSPLNLIYKILEIPVSTVFMAAVIALAATLTYSTIKIFRGKNRRNTAKSQVNAESRDLELLKEPHQPLSQILNKLDELVSKTDDVASAIKELNETLDKSLTKISSITVNQASRQT